MIIKTISRRAFWAQLLWEIAALLLFVMGVVLLGRPSWTRISSSVFFFLVACAELLGVVVALTLIFARLMAVVRSRHEARLLPQARLMSS